MKEFDKEKVIDCIFDPQVLEILSELENGGKKISYLTEKLGISDKEIKERLAYLLEHRFVNEENSGENIIYTVDGKKLSEVIENSNSFDSTIDGLTKMDSYLN